MIEILFNESSEKQSFRMQTKAKSSKFLDSNYLYKKHYLLSIKLNPYFVMSFQIIKIMCAVIILFVICWTPVKTKQIIRSYFPDLFNICSMNSFYWVTTITISFHWLAMAHSFVNPIIYSFMSKSFRVSVNHLFITLKD